MYNIYSNEIKSNCICQYTEGSAVRAISTKNNIPQSTLYYWLNQHKVIKRSNGDSITAREVYLLEKQLEKISTEKAILVEAGVAANSDYMDKIKAIAKLDRKYPIRTLCRVLDVRRSNYYHRKFRSPDKTQVEIEDEKFKPIIKRVFDKTKGRIGSSKIKALMQLEGFIISERRVSRLMKEQKLVCVSNKKFKRKNHPPKAKYSRNILNREFDVDVPNKVWISDITTVFINYEPYYLCPVIDLYARKVVGYSVGNHQETSLNELAFIKAYNTRKPKKGLIFHSDQGLQFTSYKFRNLLRQHKVTQSFSDAGCPYDNAVAESFFRHLKAEEVYPTYYPDYDSFKKSMDEYIDFFNNKRPHHSLKNKIPSYYEEDYFRKIS
jgi:putative transposase